jgi:hypothetical protein
MCDLFVSTVDKPRGSMSSWSYHLGVCVYGWVDVGVCVLAKGETEE